MLVTLQFRTETRVGHESRSTPIIITITEAPTGSEVRDRTLPIPVISVTGLTRVRTSRHLLTQLVAMVTVQLARLRLEPAVAVTTGKTRTVDAWCQDTTGCHAERFVSSEARMVVIIVILVLETSKVTRSIIVLIVTMTTTAVDDVGVAVWVKRVVYHHAAVVVSGCVLLRMCSSSSGRLEEMAVWMMSQVRIPTRLPGQLEWRAAADAVATEARVGRHVV